MAERQNIHEAPNNNLLSIWSSIIKNIKHYKYLLNRLVHINLTNEFKRSFIGMIWLLILPIIAVISWIILNGAGIVNPGDTGIPYPAFVLLSTSIWAFFVDIYKRTSMSIISNSRRIIMTKFPHEVLIAEQVAVHVIRFLIPFVLNIIVLILFGVKFTWMSLLFPLTLIPLLLLGLSIGIIVSIFRVIAVDIGTIIDEGMKILMFLTPVVYATDVSISWLAKIISFNPLTYLIGFSRDVLTRGTFYEPRIYAFVTLGTILFFILCVWVFVKSERRILERLIET